MPRESLGRFRLRVISAARLPILKDGTIPSREVCLIDTIIIHARVVRVVIGMRLEWE